MGLRTALVDRVWIVLEPIISVQFVAETSTNVTSDQTKMIQRGILTDKNTKVGMAKIYSFYYAILNVHVCIIKHADIIIIR